MIDRKTAPASQEIKDFKFTEPTIFELKNGVKVYALGGNEQEIVRTDIVLDAGNLKLPNHQAPYAAMDLLFTGAPGKTAEEIANEFDFYGAFNSKTTHFNDAEITNFSLARHLDGVYKLLAEYIQGAQFYKNELDTYKFVKVQNLTIAQQKTNYLARKAFSEAVFGKHPYGYFATEADYESLTLQQVSDFYTANKKIKYIIVSGYYNAEVIENLDKYFGGFETGNTTKTGFALTPSREKIIHVPKEDAMQCTIRMGFPTINRLHPDYHRLSVVTTLLGGFFGSRLMKNIREEKGYTYGIGAGLASYMDCGLFYIQTDVKKEVYEATVSEIFKEIERLKNEPIGDEELEILKNYSLGSFLRSIDGAFAMAEKYKTLLDYGLDYNYYDSYIRLLKNMKSEDVLETARQYLKNDEIYQVVAGI